MTQDQPSGIRPRGAEAGYSLVELLISTAIMLTVTGAIFTLMNPSHGTAQVQPELADVQQRMRVGSDTLAKELVMAGAGLYQGEVTGALVSFFAPIIPRRLGAINPDPFATVRTDAITLTYIPNTYSQTTISSPMPTPSAELKVEDQPGCPKGRELCGFEIGMQVIIFDDSGHFDLFTVTQVQHSAAHLQHRGQTFTHAYDVGSSVTHVVSNTYYLDRNTNQLRRYDGGTNDVPIVDNVVDLRFEYFGDPNPPLYPDPGPGGTNCLYNNGVLRTDVLPVLTTGDGSLAPLPPSMLNDGPWCGSGNNRFDADLLRIKRVRVMLRVQASNPALRGTDPALFVRPGTSRAGERFIPDYTTTFDVSPRNLNLAR